MKSQRTYIAFLFSWVVNIFYQVYGMIFEIMSLSEIFPPALGSATYKIPGPFWLMPKPVLLPFWLCWLGMSHSALEISAWKLLTKRLYLRYGDISETACQIAHVITLQLSPNKKGQGHRVDYETGKNLTHLDFPRIFCP